MERHTLEILEAIFGIIAGVFFLLWLILIVFPYSSTTPPLVDYFLNPFFLLLIAFGIPSGILENLRHTAEREELEKPSLSDDSIICPQCGTQNISTAKFCKQYGAKIL